MKVKLESQQGEGITLRWGMWGIKMSSESEDLGTENGLAEKISDLDPV